MTLVDGIKLRYKIPRYIKINTIMINRVIIKSPIYSNTIKKCIKYNNNSVYSSIFFKRKLENYEKESLLLHKSIF